MNLNSPELSDSEAEIPWGGVSRHIGRSLERRFGLEPTDAYCQDWELEVDVPHQKLPEILSFYEQPATTLDERKACAALWLSTFNLLLRSTFPSDLSNRHWMNEVWLAVTAILHRDQVLLKPVIDDWASWNAPNEDEEFSISPMLRKAVTGSQKSNHPSYPSIKILIAMDKFKGSLTATQAGEAVARALHPLPCDLCPIADGGEGTCEAIITAMGGHWQEVGITDAIRRPAIARYGLCPNGDAVMEMSAASGLAQILDQPLTPHLASTHGTGVMMCDAVKNGARRIIIGIGGSATNDGGIGMARALGCRFIDAQSDEVTDLPQDFERVVRIERSPRPLPEILVACDVDNPLLGERGATRVYGAQKGVTDMPFFEARLTRLADMIQRDLGTDHRDVPGAGAAGGLGFGLMSFCNAKLVSGFDLIAEVTGLEARMADATLVVTGEGKVDSQTLFGKGPAGVAEMARRRGLPVIAVAGTVEDSQAVRSRFDEAYAVKPEAMPLAEAMRRGAELIEETVVRHADRFRELASLRPA